MKNFLFSSNNIKASKGGRAVFPYLVSTAVLMLCLSFLLKTVGQAFLIVSAVLFVSIGAATLSFAKNRGGFLMCLVLGLYCVRTVFVMSGDVARTNSLQDREDCINATVVTAPIEVNEEAYGCCTVRVNFSEEGYLSKGDRVYLYGTGLLNFEIGDILEADVTYSTFSKEAAASFYSDGIYISASCHNEVIPLGTSKDIYGFAGTVRSYIKTEVMSYSDNYHILLAMITGERGYISEELYGRVIDAGVSHVLVVSGMHLVLLCGGLERILRIIFRKGILRDAILLVFVLLMSVVCGFGMSILRAAIVYLINVLYRRMGRRTNGVHSLSLAAVAVLFMHPYAFHSISFQLSYSATFGIIVLSRPLNEMLEKYTRDSFMLNKASEVLSVSVSAYIATLPVCIAAFGELSLVAVPVNILLDIPANVMLTLCVMGLALGIVPFIERIFIMLADVLADYFLKVVDFASTIPFAKLQLRNEQVLTVLVLLVYLTVYIVKTKPYRILIKR